MLEAVHLDWRVVCHPAFAVLHDRPLETGYRAILREDTGQCFGFAADCFTPVQNAETVAYFREFCDAGDLTLETVGAAQGGETVSVLARINEASVTIDGDTIKNYLLIANAHCPGHSLVIKSTMIRVVCNNTLTFALNEHGEEVGRFAHTLAKGYVKAALDTHRDSKENMESLITTSITDSAARTLLSRTLQIQSDGKKMGRILRLFHGNQRGADLTTIDGTAWGLLNAVTEHIDHEADRSRDARWRSAWFDRGEKLKQ